MTADPSERAPRLVPSGVRRPAGLLALTCTTALVVLAARYHGDRTAGRLDSWVFGQIPGVLRSHRWTLSGLAKVLPFVLVFVAGVVAAVSCIGRRWSLAALAVLAPAVTIGLTELGKQLVDRRIHGFFALPSGHTAGATSVFLVLGLLVLSRVRRNVRAAAALVAAAVTAGAALVGLVMVSVHDHYATDTVAGFCLAVAVTLAIALAMDGIRARRPLRSRRSAGRSAEVTGTAGTGPISATNGRVARSPR